MNTKINFSALLLVLLFCSLEPVSSAKAKAPNAGKDCCMKYEAVKVPLAQVVSYYRTSSSCDKPAFVFVTKRGKHICVNPADAWVTSHAAAVDSRSASIPVPVNSTGTPVRSPKA